MSERVSLDQLFVEAEPADERPRRRRWWWRDALFALLTAGGIYAVLHVFGLVSPYPVLAASVYALFLLARALRTVPVGEPPQAMTSPAWGVDDDGARLAPVDGMLRAVQRWEARFGWTERDHLRYASAVLPRLYDLADERLRQRHGCTLRNDPVRARSLVGEPLWDFLHTPVGRTPTPREITVIVAEMEKI